MKNRSGTESVLRAVWREDLMSLFRCFENNQFAVILLNMTLVLDFLEAAEVSLLKKKKVLDCSIF